MWDFYLYFRKRIPDKKSYDYLLEMKHRPMISYVYEGDLYFSMDHIKQEYPVYGATDFKYPAIEILQENGSRITNFEYVSHKIYNGKPKLSGLPATYTEKDNEASTLEILLRDNLINSEITLLYTIFNDYDAIARSVKIENKGNQNLDLTRIMSLSLDLPDYDYEFMHLSGAWARERPVLINNWEATLSWPELLQM
ncbi:glycoside hydrolase family 36 N-terminal domain-containing protein [Clostridium magnum]|nr:glycoside hydrolase family 36 N-terminal domain-containing protein [Clostridium magnum]